MSQDKKQRGQAPLSLAKVLNVGLIPFFSNADKDWFEAEEEILDSLRETRG